MNARLPLAAVVLGLAGLAFAAAPGAAAAAAAAARPVTTVGSPAATQQPPPEVAGAPTYSAAALYNEGNAAARAGRPALAVLRYERARLLAPADADIRANLQTVRRQAGLPAETDDWFTGHARYASPDTLYWCGIAGLLLVGGGLIGWRLRPARVTEAAIVTAAGIVLSALAVGDYVATQPLLHESVVMQAAAVHASPVSNGEPLFTLAPAALVRVQDRHEDFLLIRDDQGRTGWVARGDLQPIVPSDSDRRFTRS